MVGYFSFPNKILPNIILFSPNLAKLLILHCSNYKIKYIKDFLKTTLIFKCSKKEKFVLYKVN